MAALGRFLKEARRRRVFRVAGLYIVAAWIAVQVASEGFPALDIPAGAIRHVWLAAILGFPLALLFGWFYDLTPAGIRRTPDALPGATVDMRLRRFDYILLAALLVAAGGIALQLSGKLRTADLRALPADPLSIAVLPLDNLSGMPEQAYFVAGMQDALISALSRISGLRVISRTSTLAYTGSNKSAREIGSELGVSTLIEGSVYRVADRVRIIVQLIDADADDHVWEGSYESDLSDVLRLQSDISRAIADEVQVQLTTDESRQLAGVGSVKPEAYQAYLQGKFHAEMFTPEDMQLAVQFYQRAVELDPDSAEALWGLSRICRFQLQAGLVRPREAAPRCRAPLLEALQKDPAAAEVHLGLAADAWLYEYDWATADAAFRRALELNPSHSEARTFYSHFLAQMRRFGESTKEIQRARELDPLNPFVDALHGTQRIMVGDVEGGLAQVEDVIRRVPTLGFGYDVLWLGNARLGREAAALDAAIRHFRITMGQEEIAATLETVATNGSYREAMQAAAELASELAGERYIPAMEISILYELAGDRDALFAWLDRAWEQHDPTLPYISTMPPLGDAIDDPRYKALLERLNLPQWL